MNIGRILPTEAAAILNVSPQFVRVAMQQGKLPIGTAVQMSSIWTYHISEKLLADYSGKNIEKEIDLEIKGDWQVFRFEYPVMKDGKPVLDENRKQVTKGRMLDFMGFQFHHDRTTIRKSNNESARRKANHISKQDKISWYNACTIINKSIYMRN